LLNIDAEFNLDTPFNISALSNSDDLVNIPVDENPSVDAGLHEHVISSQFDA
jgi:hypothetical protein